MLFVSIEQDDFRKVSVEVRKILAYKGQPSRVQHEPTHFDNLAVHRARCLAEKPVGEEKIIRIQFLDYGDSNLDEPQLAAASGWRSEWTHVVMLRGKYNDCIKLG